MYWMTAWVYSWATRSSAAWVLPASPKTITEPVQAALRHPLAEAPLGL